MRRSGVWFFALISVFMLFIFATTLFIIKHPIRFSTEMEWAIAIYQGNSPLNMKPAEGVINPVIKSVDIKDVKAEFVADPFMIKYEGKWYMFFEVYNGITKQGDIAYALSQDALNWEYKKIVLDEPFHLSYPYVFLWDGNYYMIPESFNSGEVRLYRAISFPEIWILDNKLIDGTHVDNSILFFQNTWWLFTCSRPHNHDVTHLFYADDLRGPWSEHPLSPIIRGDANRAQGAGRILIIDNKIIRFAQQSKKTYGKAVNAYIINELNRHSYSEKAYEKNPILKAQGKGWNRHGMHHIDAHEIAPGKWIAAVDGYRKYLTIRIEY